MTKRQEKEINKLLSTLTSAYQEEAITDTIDNLGEFEYTRQSFADDCCETYRLILKRADFGGSAIYKGFKYYGDECEVQAVALAIFDILNK